MRRKMEKYVAVTKRNGSIISVGAVSAQEAYNKIWDQLLRPGREGAFDQWEHFGHLVRLPCGTIVKIVPVLNV